MPTFAAGSRLTAQLFNSAHGEAVTHAPLDQGFLNTGAFTATRTGATSPVGVAFTAPTSGKVLVTWAAGIVASATGQAFGMVGFRIGTGATVGAGTEVVAPSETRALQHSGTAASGSANTSTHVRAEDQFGRVSLVTGLTAGTVYNAQVMFRTVGGQCDFGRVEITVKPTT